MTRAVVVIRAGAGTDGRRPFYKIRVLVSRRVQAGLRAPSFRSSFRILAHIWPPRARLHRGGRTTCPASADAREIGSGRIQALPGEQRSAVLPARYPGRSRSQVPLGHEHHPLQDARGRHRIQLDLYDNLAIDEIRLGATVLEYERELNSFFVKFPSTLKAGKSRDRRPVPGLRANRAGSVASPSVATPTAGIGSPRPAR